jgi:hypothetical protein
MPVVKELSTYTMDSVVQEIRWDRGGTKQAEEYIISYEKNENHELGIGFFFFNKMI